MASDVCKHCTESACLDVCPTGALFRTEFGTVVVQDDVCNGCGYCVAACPFGVIARREEDGQAHKCTLCYDRLGAGLEPACAKACPTESIQFGPLDELRERAGLRVADLRASGQDRAQLYLADPDDGIGGGGAFFLLLDEPEVYGLPPDPVVTTRDLPDMWRHVAIAAAGLAATAVALALGRRGGADRDARAAELTAGGAAGGTGARGEELMVPEATFSSYYGRPVIKEPVWKNPDVPGYLFLGGLAGASSVLAAGAQLSGYRPLARAAKISALGAISLSAVALINDLGRPARFVNMLRVFKPSSPMSVGSWLLAGYGPVAGAAAVCEVTGLLPGPAWPPPWARACSARVSRLTPPR